MNKQYYLVENGQSKGPFSLENLKRQKLQRETLVWTEGLNEWTNAENIPQLKDVFSAIPPPVPDIETEIITQTIPPPIPEISEPHLSELSNEQEAMFTKCQFCYEDVSIYARVCPFCHKTQLSLGELKLMAYNTIFFNNFLLIVVLVILAFGYKWWAGLIVIILILIILSILQDRIIEKYPAYYIKERFGQEKKDFYITLIIIIVGLFIAIIILEIPLLEIVNNFLDSY